MTVFGGFSSNSFKFSTGYEFEGRSPSLIPGAIALPYPWCDRPSMFEVLDSEDWDVAL
ncbi:MAG: hypothetical protein VKJ64_13405 [Leptolyngbyaceae bacterium]|nr:hypothetical protein [Leptolyngbyaceae bacterium]